MVEKIENANKTIITKVIKISSIIDYANKYSWAISNANIDATRNLEPTSIKKY